MARIWQVQGKQSRLGPDRLAREALLQVGVNGKPAYQLLYLPGQEIELALGFLVCRGVIEQAEELKEVRFIPAASGNNPPWPQVLVRLHKSFEPQSDLSLTTAAALVAGQPLAPLPARQFRPPRPESLTLTVPRLLDLMAKLAAEQEIFRQTGATHAILLVEPSGNILAGAEDIGRHNAFDKVIGQALLKNLPTAGAIALLSGRASFEMVFKAARLGVPLVCSVSAPTSLALALAEAQGITLVGFAREGRANIYTQPQRLTDLPSGV